ncbi:(d)CMP kinase [Tropicibacter naphthalenivorans]|uniref:Cytidylate kinase n=1 Tax=Tropicibacter naphthalenivorans TaxID=441103 RepID=A0A0P1GKN5_9RHOB|nr:(d)CMP kinase [Tropicibacter naphthalenivorans]CUH82484.1 Cytidylate kinase [Tropicibacter naphthalenivorans]SMD07157.1 cytidylate kinase [Tropicibacter naphthalenivorans]
MAFTVAIDGPAASGKGTISREIAAFFGFEHLDTGLLYRAVGFRLLEGIEPIEAAKTLDMSALDPDALRTPDVAQAASKVAAIPEVRAALVDFQRAFATRAGGAVLDGRDIGTVICPEANVKLFVIASPEVRATRRHKELVEKGLEVSFDEVLADVLERDARDMNRQDAPLKPAEDALVIDTTDLSIADAVAQVVEIITEAGGAD